jgi:hypothetical protein
MEKYGSIHLLSLDATTLKQAISCGLQTAQAKGAAQPGACLGACTSLLPNIYRFRFPRNNID